MDMQLIQKIQLILIKAKVKKFKILKTIAAGDNPKIKMLKNFKL